MHEYVRWLLTQAEIVTDLPKLHIVTHDPKDDPIIATAVAAKADYLVTGDRAHLLPLRQYEGARILSSKELLDILL